MAPEVAYVVLGATLTAALAAIVAFTYRRRRRDRLERPKYRMMEDDD